MLSMKKLRRLHPEYADKSDEELARFYHSRAYGDTSYEDFARDFAAVNQRQAERQERRGGKGGGASSGKSGKSDGKPPVAERSAMGKKGYIWDDATCNYWPIDPNGEGKAAPDFSKEPASDEVVAAVLNPAANSAASYRGNTAGAETQTHYYDDWSAVEPMGLGGVRDVARSGERNWVLDYAAERERQDLEELPDPLEKTGGLLEGLTLGESGNGLGVYPDGGKTQARFGMPSPPDPEQARQAAREQRMSEEKANSVDLGTAAGLVLRGMMTTYGKPTRAY